MDDCLSALDAHVAQRVFHEAICGPLLSGTTRILVSHHTQVQKSADLLLYTFDQRPTVSLNADSELIKALPDSVRTLITAPDRVPTELGPANVRGIVAKRSVLAREGSLVGGGGSGDPRLRKHPSRLFLGSSDHYPSELVPLKDGLDEAEDSRVLEGRAAPHAMLDPSLLGGCMDADPSPLKLGPGLSAANRAALFALQRSGSDVGLGSPSGPRKVSLIAPRRAVFEGFSESEVSTPRVSGSSGREDVLSTLSNLSGGGGGRAAAPDRTDLLKRASDTRRIANFIATNAENAQGPRFYESESISEDADLAGPADGPGAHVPAHAHMRLPEEPLEEGRFHGRVPKHVYWVYMLAAGPFLVVVVLISLLLMQASRNGTDLYIAFWSAHAAKSTKPALYFLGWLILLAVANSLLTLIRAFSFANGGINAARTIHDRLLYAVLRAPCAFFDINSRGRVVNRFSSDTSAVDDAAPFIFNIFLANVAAFLGIVAVLCFAQPLMLVVLVPLTFFYLRLQRFYRATSREVRRLDSTSKSPVYAFFAEVIEGLSTIRGLGAADLFILRGDTHLRKYQRAALAGLGISQWLSVRLQLVSAVVITALGTLFVLQREILARHSKKHPPHGVTSSPPLPPYGVLPTTSGRPEYGESEYDGANAARSLLEHGFEWVLQMTMASAFGVEGEDGQRVFVETSPHMAPHVHGVGKSGGAASTWWNYSFTASMLASLVGLSLSYALPLTGLLNGLLTSSAESEQEMVSLERIAEYIGTSGSAARCSNLFVPSLYVFSTRSLILSIFPRPHLISVHKPTYLHIPITRAETATVMTESHESAATAPGLAASSPPGGTGFLRGRSPDLEGDADLDLDFDYGPAPTGRFGGRENLSSLAHLSQLMAERQGSVALFRAQNILRPAGERKHGARGPGAPPGGLFRPQVGARGPRGPYPRANATGGLTEQDWRVIDYVHRSSVQLRRFLRWAGRAPARWARRLRLGALGGGRSGSLSAMDSLDLDGSDSELMDPEGRNRSEGTPSSCVSIPLTPRLGPSGPMAIGGAGYVRFRKQSIYKLLILSLLQLSKQYCHHRTLLSEPYVQIFPSEHHHSPHNRRPRDASSAPAPITSSSAMSGCATAPSSPGPSPTSPSASRAPPARRSSAAPAQASPRPSARCSASTRHSAGSSRSGRGWCTPRGRAACARSSASSRRFRSSSTRACGTTWTPRAATPRKRWPNRCGPLASISGRMRWWLGRAPATGAPAGSAGPCCRPCPRPRAPSGCTRPRSARPSSTRTRPRCASCTRRMGTDPQPRPRDPSILPARRARTLPPPPPPASRPRNGACSSAHRTTRARSTGPSSISGSSRRDAGSSCAWRASCCSGRRWWCWTSSRRGWTIGPPKRCKRRCTAR